MAYRNDPIKAIHYAAESSRTTHGATAAIDACKFYATLILAALEGRSKDELLSLTFTLASSCLKSSRLLPVRSRKSDHTAATFPRVAANIKLFQFRPCSTPGAKVYARYPRVSLRPTVIAGGIEIFLALRFKKMW